MSGPGAEIPVLNPIVFDSIASHFAPDAVVAYLQTIDEQGTALLRAGGAKRMLRWASRMSWRRAQHIRSLDALVYSASRLSALRGRFEFAVQLNAADAAVLADALGGAIEATLQAMPELSEKNQTGGCHAPDA